MSKTIENEKIAYDRLSLVAYETPRVVFASTLLALMLTVFSYRELQSDTLIIWFIVHLLLSLVRIFHYLSYKKNHSRHSYKRDYFLIGVGLLLTTLLWAVVAVIIFPATLEARLFLVICIAGLTAGSTTTNAYVYEFFVLTSLLLMLPLISLYIFDGTELSYYIAAALTLYLGMVLMIAKQSQENVNKVFVVGYENKQLIQELQKLVEKRKKPVMQRVLSYQLCHMKYEHHSMLS